MGVPPDRPKQSSAPSPPVVAGASHACLTQAVGLQVGRGEGHSAWGPGAHQGAGGPGHGRLQRRTPGGDGLLPAVCPVRTLRTGCPASSRTSLTTACASAPAHPQGRGSDSECSTPSRGGAATCFAFATAPVGGSFILDTLTSHLHVAKLSFRNAIISPYRHTVFRPREDKRLGKQCLMLSCSARHSTATDHTAHDSNPCKPAICATLTPALQTNW